MAETPTATLSYVENGGLKMYNIDRPLNISYPMNFGDAMFLADGLDGK